MPKAKPQDDRQKADQERPGKGEIHSRDQARKHAKQQRGCETAQEYTL
jgi:hypothetical protein